MNRLRPIHKPLHTWLNSAGISCPSRNPLIKGLSDHSGQVQAQEAFICLPRSADRAQEFVHAAALAGAACVLHPSHIHLQTELPCIAYEHMAQLGHLLKHWYHNNDSKLQVFGVTGTDGKTSITWMLRQLLERHLGSCWSLGTLGWQQDTQQLSPLSNTTPSLLSMHKTMALAQQEGIAALVCEVSSHGIAQQRIAGIDFQAALCSNIGHDHLEDHGGLQAYASCKAGFLETLRAQDKTVIINADNERLMDYAPKGCRSYGRGLNRHDTDLAWEIPEAGSALFSQRGKPLVTLQQLPLGAFHAENLCACLSLMQIYFHVQYQQWPALCHQLSSPPGRLQRLYHQYRSIYIDYAHTPEGLQCCLRTVEALGHQRLLLVFGCGGDRDQSKRPQMGRIAMQHCQSIWITSDNPRSEDPQQIIEQIAAGMQSSDKVHQEVDRAKAIEQAVQSMQPGDALIIAGKGAETSMAIQGSLLPWSDVDIAQQCLQQWGTS